MKASDLLIDAVAEPLLERGEDGGLVVATDGDNEGSRTALDGQR
jgi:hypothetical protein